MTGGMEPVSCCFWPAELSQCLTQKGPGPSIYHLMSLIFAAPCSAAAPASSRFCLCASIRSDETIFSYLTI